MKLICPTRGNLQNYSSKRKGEVSSHFLALLFFALPTYCSVCSMYGFGIYYCIPAWGELVIQSTSWIELALFLWCCCLADYSIDDGWCQSQRSGPSFLSRESERQYALLLMWTLTLSCHPHLWWGQQPQSQERTSGGDRMMCYRQSQQYRVWTEMGQGLFPVEHQCCGGECLTHNPASIAHPHAGLIEELQQVHKRADRRAQVVQDLPLTPLSWKGLWKDLLCGSLQRSTRLASQFWVLQEILSTTGNEKLRNINKPASVMWVCLHWAAKIHTCWFVYSSQRLLSTGVASTGLLPHLWWSDWAQCVWGKEGRKLTSAVHVCSVV